MKYEWTLKDRDGQEHHYEQPAYPPDTAFAVLGQIIELAAKVQSSDVSSLVFEVSRVHGLLNLVFSGCRRDGQLLDREGGRIAAYTANYGEMFAALKTIMEYQVVPFLPDGIRSVWSDLTGSLDELLGALREPDKPSEQS